MLEDTLVLRSKISPTMKNKICTGKIYSNNKKRNILYHFKRSIKLYIRSRILTFSTIIETLKIH